VTGNVLILLSDQHRRDVLGCYGNRHVETPALDRLAARGTRFSRAYCNAPICVPSRASLATGLHIHQIPSWDNADPYYGQRTSFMHRAREGAVHTTSIGKLHFRSVDDDNGFDHEIDPMHVVGGTGTFTSLLRDPIPRITAASDMLRNAGPGKTSYGAYDARIRDHAVHWLIHRGRDALPFLLFVSFVNPHPPYVAPSDLFHHYMAMDLVVPKASDVAAAPSKPGLNGLRTYFDIDGADLTQVQIKAVTAAYYANVAALDRNIGAVLEALELAGLEQTTTVLYASDHGESLGDQGLYGKCNMFEQSMGVPMILAGPRIPNGVVRDMPVQLLDVYPTVIDALGLAPADADTRRNSTSLVTLASGMQPWRTVLAQQHCAGVSSGVFGLSDGRWKYIFALDAPPMVFDLQSDPDEATNLADDSQYQQTRMQLHETLCSMLDPISVDAACKQSQHRRLDAAGGEDAVLARPNQAFSSAPDTPTS
jgi:choline-sulfatase